ncbi:uncharacterized protein [Aristolochia californica]|uniref:uncharacterized protein n=1 Tax=Aristolochia californica TaxID=171875 RepID=UPI0035E1E5D1
MGNYLSCTLNTAPGRLSRGAKVIVPDGDIRQFDCPINAAELMFETPNHFLVNSGALKIGCRFAPLSADEDLEIGNVYVMFHMKRVNSVVTAADMEALLITANSAVSRASVGKARILPEVGAAPQLVAATEGFQRLQSDAPRLNLDELEDDWVIEFKSRWSLCRSRKPMLETIVEENVFSR